VQREWEVRLRARVNQAVGQVKLYDAPDPVQGFVQQVLKEAGREQQQAADVKVIKVGCRRQGAWGVVEDFTLHSVGGGQGWM
jgi:hypothetical protein